MEQDRKPGDKPTHLCHLIYASMHYCHLVRPMTVRQEYTMEKRQPLQ